MTIFAQVLVFVVSTFVLCLGRHYIFLPLHSCLFCTFNHHSLKIWIVTVALDDFDIIFPFSLVPSFLYNLPLLCSATTATLAQNLVMAHYIVISNLCCFCFITLMVLGQPHGYFCLMTLKHISFSAFLLDTSSTTVWTMPWICYKLKTNLKYLIYIYSIQIHNNP
jgi:hypothetical protein